MSKKEIEAVAKKFEEYYAQFPDWYWKYGLHDAKILSVCELELEPDWKEKHPKRNCLEILLDCKNALCERNIKKISLYNYKILSTDINFSSFEEGWWIKDTIKVLDNQKYLLKIEIVLPGEKHKNVVIQFDIPEIERK